MVRDYLGNEVTVEHGGTLQALNDFIEGYLAYETRAERIIEAADHDSAACLANVYAGMLWMLLEAPEASQRAAPYAAAAVSAASVATRRERLNAAMLQAWVRGDAEAAEAICEQITDDFPRDLAIIKLQQYFAFNRGDSPAMLRTALKAAQAAAEVPYVHGMLAFGFEQCHLLEEAEDAARTALEMRGKEPWAQHALAHVLLTRGRIDEGAAFLEAAAPRWTGLNSFILTHNWWHLVLFYLSQGRDRAALDAYDRHCWAIAKAYSQDQIGAISLLARFEVAGIDVGERWQDVAEHVRARRADTVQPFLTLQYLYGLTRAGRPEAQELLTAVRAHAPQAAAVWREVALPVCEGLMAHATGRYDEAWRRLEPALPRIGEVGGSHAQRDLFEQLALDSAIKSGRWVSAQQSLERRRQSDPDGVALNLALARVYDQLQLPGLAGQARARAASTRARHGG